jgi:hypothetical protein
VTSRFVRKVRTASGAVAVQVVTKEHGKIVEVDHVGSAHSDPELGLLVQAAREVLRGDQGELDLGDLRTSSQRVGDVADWTRGSEMFATSTRRGRPASVAGSARVVSTGAELLWEVLDDAYGTLGFDVLGDDAFKALVLARIIEPTSKAESIRVLSEVGVRSPSLRTIFRCLRRSVANDYRNTLARACFAYSTKDRQRLSLVLYDVTTLYFEAENEDELRKVGMSKERRVDPQIQVGLLVDPEGFPLEVCCFEGNKAETKTLIPVLESFKARHEITDLVVVADAGMLSASNLNALEDGGFSFIVGSRITKAPYDLAEHFERKGNHFADGEILESTRVMGTAKAARRRRVVYQYSFKRAKHDDKAINAMVERAEKVADV